MRNLILIIICMMMLTLVGCVDKSVIKNKIDHADRMVSSMTSAGFNTFDDRDLVDQAKGWYAKYEQKQDFTNQEEQEINTLVQALEQRMPQWEAYSKKAYSREVESYFNYNTDRKSYWKHVAMSCLKEGMNKTEVKLIKGEPHEVGKAYSGDKLLDRWSYSQTTLWFENGILQSWE